MGSDRPTHSLNSGRWNRGLVIAAREGALSGGACNLGLRLSAAILWSPEDGRPPGLYWSVKEVVAAVGIGLSTWKRGRKELAAAGFLRLERGNYLPMLPPRFNRSLTDPPPEGPATAPPPLSKDEMDRLHPPTPGVRVSPPQPTHPGAMPAWAQGGADG